ncbi:zincin [Mytilinidion resinicola]|uniref:Zincin n=1 Tax=Mytilinidion resinicola TaxID=574789 RepID=A0A6A6Y4E1_9PEZI|nr:zincin [Mytilinidion resinicola]KAF2803499.1 zincin [Mytilinidion resinicola]
MKASTSLVLVLALALAAPTTLSAPLSTKGSTPAAICTSDTCARAANEILHNRHPDYKKIDPWIHCLPQPCRFERLLTYLYHLGPNQTDDDIDPWGVKQREVELLSREILESPFSGDGSVTNQENFKQLQDAYAACMDETTTKKAGLAPLKSLLGQISKRNVTDMVLLLLENGIEALASISVAADERHPKSTAVYIGPYTTISSPQRTLSHIKGKTISYNPHTIKETDELLPQISISRIVSALGPSDFSTNRVIVRSLDFMKSLSQLINKTPNDTLHRYFIWRATEAYHGSFQYAGLEDSYQWWGQDRWKTCITVAQDTLGLTFDHFYAQKANFSQEAKDYADRIVGDVKDELKTALGRAKWINKAAQDEAIQKANIMRQHIGYSTSPDIMNADDLKQHYSGLVVTNSTFFDNTVNSGRFKVKKEWSGLGKPSDPNAWDWPPPFHITTVNAVYGTTENSFHLPAAACVMDTDPSLPQYISYSRTGALAGHEMFHGFDNEGVHFDRHGHAFTWKNETEKKLNERTSCFVKQYNAFNDPLSSSRLRVYGERMLPEILADTGGLKAAFAAWKKLDKENPDKAPPDLQEYTKEQLFMLSYASPWCARSSKMDLFHPPYDVRVDGTLANLRGFREAFNCPVKEPTCALF